MTLSELIESLQTAKYESDGDPEVPFEGVYWDGESIAFVTDAEPALVGVEITDEAGVVEAMAKAMFADEHCDKQQMADVDGNWESRLNDEDQALYRSMARAALRLLRCRVRIGWR